MKHDSHRKLDLKKTGLLIVDVQSKLMPLMVHAEPILQRMCMVVEGAQALQLPIFLAEQYPQGLGETVPALKQLLSEEVKPHTKTLFSAAGDPAVRAAIESQEITHWILIGIEAHVCVQQTAKDLMEMGAGVVVLNDAVSAASVVELSTAIAEMRDFGVRVSCAESVLFELLGDSKAPAFKEISQLIKESRALQPVIH